MKEITLKTLIATLGTVKTAESKLKICGDIFSLYSLSEVKETIDKLSQNGFQGSIGAGSRVLAKMLYQVY